MPAETLPIDGATPARLTSDEVIQPLTFKVATYVELLPDEQKQVKDLLQQQPNADESEEERLARINPGRGGRLPLLYLAGDGKDILGMICVSLRNTFGGDNFPEDQKRAVIEITNDVAREENQENILTQLLRHSIGRMDRDITARLQEAKASGNEDKFISSKEKAQGLTVDNVLDQLTHPVFHYTTIRKTGMYSDHFGRQRERLGNELRAAVLQSALENGWNPKTEITETMSGDFAQGVLTCEQTEKGPSLVFTLQPDRGTFLFPIEINGESVSIPARQVYHTELRYSGEEDPFAVYERLKAKFIEKVIVPPEDNVVDDEEYKECAIFGDNEHRAVADMGLEVERHGDFKIIPEPDHVRIHFQKLPQVTEETATPATQ